MRRLGHATQDAALRVQHATDERDRAMGDVIDKLIRAAKEEPTTPVIPIRRAVSDASDDDRGVR